MLLIHGVTASHLSWPLVAERLPGVRVIAPDLRGRGRSNGVRGPAGLAAHARDLVAVLDALDVDRAVVVGHSMGAFVALVLGDLYPERVSRLVLVDGGLPLDVPAGLSPDEVIQLVLGPTAERLAMRFASVDDVPGLLARAPGVPRDWSPALEAYLAYDLVGEAPGPAPGDELRDARRGLDRPEHRARPSPTRWPGCGIRLCCSRPSADCSTRCRRCTRPSVCPGCSRRTPGLRHARWTT